MNTLVYILVYILRRMFLGLRYKYPRNLQISKSRSKENRVCGIHVVKCPYFRVLQERY